VNAEDILAEVEALGVTVHLDGDNLRLRPGSAVPPSLVEELRAHKPELVELVGLRGWPKASRDAVCKFGAPEARLYPFLGKMAATPLGAGHLLAVLPDRAGVALGHDPARIVWVLPSEVWPPGMATEPRKPFEVVH
jgi:TubC N-terminal docking domain